MLYIARCAPALCLVMLWSQAWHVRVEQGSVQNMHPSIWQGRCEGIGIKASKIVSGLEEDLYVTPSQGECMGSDKEGRLGRR